MEIKLPELVKYVIETLNENNYSAYIVGGCVRDSLMGIEPKDWDITTNATPEDITKIFEDECEILPTGIKYGTVSLKFSKQCNSPEIFEVTTFRADVYDENADGRRPSEVKFGENILDDLARRDLTINAIAYHPDIGFIDPYEGIKDIENKLIKFVGNTTDRLKEDGLRILRAIRFAFKYNFNINQITVNELNGCYSYLQKISKERIHEELMKILMYASGKSDIKLNDFRGIFDYIFEAPPPPIYAWVDSEENKKKIEINNEFTRILAVVSDNKYSNIDKIYAILKTIKNIYEAEIWLRKYKFTNGTIKRIIAYYNIEKDIPTYKDRSVDITIKELAYKYNKDNLDHEYVFNFVNNYSSLFSDSNLDMDLVKKWIYEDPYNLDKLKINGQILYEKFNLVGREIGEVLDYLMHQVIADKSLNIQDTLLELTDKYIQERYKYE